MGLILDAVCLYQQRSSKQSAPISPECNPHNLFTKTPSGREQSTQERYAYKYIHNKVQDCCWLADYTFQPLAILLLGKSHLQDNGKLFRWVAVFYSHRQPYLECCQLFSKEWTVLLEKQWTLDHHKPQLHTLKTYKDCLGLKSFKLAQCIGKNCCYFGYLGVEWAKVHCMLI